MNPNPLLIRRHSPQLLELRLNRPQQRNAFDAAMIAGLRAAFADCHQDAGLRAVLLASEGSVFCAGADLAWMRSSAAADPADSLAEAQALAELLWLIHTCPVPVICRVQGAAMAGGMGLVAACDIAIASSEARFALSEVRLGLLPATIGPYVARAIGLRAMRRYLLTAEILDAATARDLGLLHQVCSADALDAAVALMAQRVCQNGPAAVRAGKRLLMELDAAALTPELRLRTAELIAGLRTSPEGREGIQAFLDKRPPAWQLP